MKKILLTILIASIAMILSACLSPAEKHARRGDLFMQQGYWDNAIAEYETAQEVGTSIAVNRRLSHAYANRGHAYFLSANYDAAIADFQNALRQDGAADVSGILADSFKARAMQYINNGEFDRAIEDADAVLKNYNSSDAFAYYLVGTALIGKGEWDLAMVELSKAVGLDETIDTDLKLPQAYIERAKLLIAEDKQVEAVKYIEQAIILSNKALERDPKSTAAYRRLANALILLQEYDTALTNLNKAIEIDPNDSVAYTLIAEIQSKLGNSDGALSNLDKAITADPNNATAYYQRAVIYLERDQADLVIADLSKAIELNPLFYLHFNRAMVYRTIALQSAATDKTDLLKLAIADFTTSIDMQPNLYQSYFWRGRSYFDLQQWGMAEADLKKAIELSNDPETNRSAQNLLTQIAGLEQ